MYELPRTILVINIIRYTNNDEVVDILKEFFEGIPHIDITDYESNRQSIQYIILGTYKIVRLVHKFYSIQNSDKLIDYSCYTHKGDNLVNNSYYYYARNSSIGLPKELIVDLATAEKLQLLRSV
jgi:hypothetical protein